MIGRMSREPRPANGGIYEGRRSSASSVSVGALADEVLGHWLVNYEFCSTLSSIFILQYSMSSLAAPSNSNPACRQLFDAIGPAVGLPDRLYPCCTRKCWLVAKESLGKFELREEAVDAGAAGAFRCHTSPWMGQVSVEAVVQSLLLLSFQCVFRFFAPGACAPEEAVWELRSSIIMLRRKPLDREEEWTVEVRKENGSSLCGQIPYSTP